MLRAPRMRIETPSSFAATVLATLALAACEREPPAPAATAARSAPELPSAFAVGSSGFAPRPVSSQSLALSRNIQATKLRIPLERRHEPRLAFGRGVLGQLTEGALRVYDLTSFELVATAPIERPRAVLSLADGALLAIGSGAMLHYEPGNRRVTPRVRPALLWGDIYADSQRPNRIWIFDGAGSAALGPARLLSFALIEGGAGVALPEQTIELASARGGAFGPTREGVWLYLTPRRAERLSPGGLRLPGLTLPEGAPPARILPAQRLDQCLLVEETGVVSRALAVPPFQRLSEAKLAGDPYALAVADEGRLLAATVVTGAGPRFELQLLDAQLRSVARVGLASDTPTGDDDWLRVVTQDQSLAASATRPLVAVGGPGRLTIFGADAKPIFSIHSK